VLQYYTPEIHKASFVLPAFAKRAIFDEWVGNSGSLVQQTTVLRNYVPRNGMPNKML
jgi:hypothetical protein